MFQITGEILLAFFAPVALGGLTLSLLFLLSRVRLTKSPEQIAQSKATSLTRKRLVLAIVFGMLGMWAFVLAATFTAVYLSSSLATT